MPFSTTLKSRNVTIDNRRTSMRLEPEVWEALWDIARRERLSIHDLCSHVNTARRQSSLTSAVRVYALAYYRGKVANTLEPPLLTLALSA